MKKLKIYIAAGVLVLSAVTSCKKTELYPYSQIEVSQAFKTVKDATAWDNGMYALLRARTYGNYMYYSDVQADQLNATLDFGNRNGAPHRWDFTSDDQTLSPIWAGYYNSIANINTALAGFKTITPASSAETTLLNQYTGDAYLARAFYYHALVTRFAKPYETATASTDLGVPLLTVYDLTAQPSRATVKAVYDQIISDITTAEGLLANVAGTQGANKFTIDAARALEARVRLYMHDYTGAYNAANTLIASNKYPLISSQAAFTAYWATDGVQESITQLFVDNVNNVPNTNPIYLGLVTATLRYDPDFLPTATALNMFSSADIRTNAYFAVKPTTINAVQKSTLTLVNKYPGNPIYYTAATTNYINQPKIFRIAEMYLIAAEAAIGASNEANALTALNALRVARGIGPVTLTGSALVQAVRDERYRELAFEGFRLNDLQRWHLGFDRGVPQDATSVYTGSQYTGIVITPDALKFVWGIPTNDIIVNKNLVQNPGW